MSETKDEVRLKNQVAKLIKERQQFSDAFDIEFKDNQELIKEIKIIKAELEDEKKIVDYYADNGYSVAIKRVKARVQL
jgi:hypothetical protein